MGRGGLWLDFSGRGRELTLESLDMQALAHEGANPLASSAGIGLNRKALIIEDYMLIRRNHKLLLEKLGFEVYEAADGEEAMKRLRSVGAANVSLMLVDLVMPVMNGADFIYLCRKEFGAATPQVIVCSSVSDLPIIKKVVTLGIDGYVVKPVDYKLLIKKIEALFPR